MALRVVSLPATARTQDEEGELLGAQDIIVRGGDESTDDVATWMPFPLVTQCSRIAEDLGCRDRRIGVVVGVVIGHHLVRPLEDLPPVSLRESDQVGNRLERQFAHDVRDEVSEPLSLASRTILVARPRSTSSSRATEHGVNTPRDTTPRTLVWRGSSMLSIICFWICRYLVADRAAVELRYRGVSSLDQPDRAHDTNFTST